MAAGEWTILADRVSKWQSSNPGPLTRYALFVIQHVLDDLYHLLRAFCELGCDPKDISVVGIPYSSRQAAGDAIYQRLGCKVHLPKVFPFDGCVCTLLTEALAEAEEKEKRLIILEDGGYAVPLVSQLAPLNRIDTGLIAGAVEQTSRGVRVDLQLLHSGSLLIPVISIPDCETKKSVEPIYIAEAVLQNLTNLLNGVDPGRGIRQIRTLGIYGYGTIGDRVGKRFGNDGVCVYVNEVSPSRRYHAYVASQCQQLTEASLGECDLVLGSTGSTSIGQQVFTRVKEGAILASASSRQVEIEMERLFAMGRGEPVGPSGECVMAIPAARRFHYPIKGGSKSVTVLYDGYPLNFYGRSLPDHVGDAILSLLLEGVLTLATGPFPQAGVYNGGTVLQEADIEISQLWQQVKPDDGINPFGL